MKTRVEFKSAAFPKYPNEGDEIVNEHLWGKRLAEFVRDTLPKYGVQTEDISSEDWGWMVDIRHDAFPVWIGCGVMDEPNDDDDDDNDEGEDGDAPPRKCAPSADQLSEFALFVTAEPGFFQKLFKKVDPNPVIASVVSALERMMADHSSHFVEPVWD